MKFSEEHKDAIWKCLAAILHLGEVAFDPVSFDDPSMPSKPGKCKTKDRLEIVAQLLGISPEYFEKILLQEASKFGKEFIWKPMGFKKASDNKDALSKQLYNNLFNWLVKRMNLAI